jgi:hypothetical protein
MAESIKPAKKRNYDIVRRMITSQYWLPENRLSFTGDFSLELPNAPPGMPQYFNPLDTLLHMDWLSRTVKTWKVKPHFEIYGTKNDENLFWVVRESSGDVCWGGVDGKFNSRMVSRIRLENGKIKHMKELFDPLKFLEAIGAKVPIFHVKIDWKEVERVKKAAAKQKKTTAAIDNSPEAVAKRLASNLAVYTDPNAGYDAVTQTEDCDMKVWFLPPEMKETYFGDEKIGIDIWSRRSIISARFLPDAVIYETDVPNTYFVECGFEGVTEWLGNNVRGAYRNRYVMFHIYENGAMKAHHEYLNPINKFNSINKSLPSFPYYF